MDRSHIVDAINSFLFQTEPSVKIHHDPVSRDEYLDFVQKVRTLLKTILEEMEN